MADADALRQRMVDGLAQRGELDERWRAAFAEVPRHEFIPELVWHHDRDASGSGDLVPVRRCDDAQGWLERAYANTPVITQVDDGHPAGDGGCGFEVTSSASMPAVVAQMLGALDAQPGMRVLEIGTGTGYNAALLAHRLGAGDVVSVEVDPAVAEHARHALAATGFGAVTVVTADGAEGYPTQAPYDRVISTAAVATVPHAWLAQTRPAGMVLTPWGTAYYPGGLLALTVHRDATATGRIVGPASFMWLRAQRIPRYTTSRIVRHDDTATASTTDLHPWHAVGDAHAATAIGLRVPQCENFYHPDSAEAEAGTLYLVDQWSRSWATLEVTTDLPYEVRQSGQRKLWDEVATAHRWWLDIGKPAADAWRFTIDPRAQRIELVLSGEPSPDPSSNPVSYAAVPQGPVRWSSQ
ncbi:MAG: methyltransferase domain-containing protein [Pseudonocardiaceae bacterium]